MTEPFIIPINEAARRLGVCRDTIYKLIEKGELRSVHVFKRHMVRLDSVAEFLDRHETVVGHQRPQNRGYGR